MANRLLAGIVPEGGGVVIVVGWWDVVEVEVVGSNEQRWHSLGSGQGHGVRRCSSSTSPLALVTIKGGT